MKKSKIISMVLSLAMVLSLCPAMDFTTFAETVTLGDWVYFYTIGDSEVQITQYTGSETDVIIPGEIDGHPVTSIAYRTFLNRQSITSVTIQNSVKEIKGDAFFGCKELTSITIPSSVESIGIGAFSGCMKLTDIIVDENNPNYSSVDSVLYNKDKTKLICCSEGKTDTSFTIPDSVTSIDRCAFQNCTRLTSVTIPNSVTSIGYGAFQDCTSLTSVTIPNSVTSIGYGAFLRCKGLTSVTIGNSVESIATSAFQECESLTSVTMPSSVKSIGEYAFFKCTGLASVTIPSSVTSIGQEAFNGCNNLKTVYINKTTNPYGNIFGQANIILVPNKIELTKKPDKTLYTVGQDLDTAGMVVTYYENGTGNAVTNYETSGFDKAKTGAQTITVTYGGCTASFTVKVFNKVNDIKTLDPSTIEDGGKITTGYDAVGKGALDGFSKIWIGENILKIDDEAVTTDAPITIYGYAASEAESFCNRVKAAKPNINFGPISFEPGSGCVTGGTQREMKDVLALFKGVAQDETDRLFCPKAVADMNGDNNITLVDVLMLLMQLQKDNMQPTQTKPSTTV